MPPEQSSNGSGADPGSGFPPATSQIVHKKSPIIVAVMGVAVCAIFLIVLVSLLTPEQPPTAGVNEEPVPEVQLTPEEKMQAHLLELRRQSEADGVTKPTDEELRATLEALGSESASGDTERPTTEDMKRRLEELQNGQMNVQTEDSAMGAPDTEAVPLETER